MEFLYFYDQANLSRDNLKKLYTGVAPLNNSPIVVSGSDDHKDFSVMMTFETSGVSPKSELITNKGNSFTSGFDFGITDTNRLYLITPNQAFTFNKPLAKKNTIALIKSSNTFSLFLYNHFSNKAEIEIYRANNSYDNSSDFKIANTFVGEIDQFVYINKSIFESTADYLLSGFKDVTLTSSARKSLSESVSIQYPSNQSSIQSIEGLNSLNSGIYEYVRDNFTTNYPNEKFVSGFVEGLTNTGSLNVSLEGEFHSKDSSNDQYLIDQNIAQGTPFSISAPLASTYKTEVRYHNDGLSNSILTLSTKYEASSIQADPFYIHTTISQRWGTTTGVTESGAYLNDFVMEGINIFNPEVKGAANYTASSFEDDPSRKNQQPKYSILDNSYKTQPEFNSIYAYINRSRTQIDLNNNKIISGSAYEDTVRYEDSASSTLLSTAQGSETIQLDYRPRTSQVTDGSTYLILEKDYLETSSADSLFNKNLIAPTGLIKTISIT